VSVHLVHGEDPVLRDEILDRVLNDLLDGSDAALAVEELTVPGRAGAVSSDDGDAPPPEGRDAVVGQALLACQSPPFMTACRIVVLRDAGNLTAADAGPLVEYIGAPLPTTELVLVAGGGRLPAELTKALKATKAREHRPGTEKTADVLREHLETAGITVRPDAARTIAAHLGEDAGRVPKLVDMLSAAYGEGATLGADEIEPYLGGVGAVPGYELTNALEQGDIAGALETLHRMMSATGPRQRDPMHPLQVLGLLHSHYRKLLRLDDPAIRSSADAVVALGGRIKEYPARKALAQARALGSDGLRQAFDRLATADLDVKGARGIPADAVLEVLVERLAALSTPSRGISRRRTR
jgi:DNA polymerase III subunit delta